ncbi:hypothetical protein MACH26_19160 [Planctobacterium marinum]|uniref:Uncharacterized protein n=1 Tax=Planctobacterium marinum TaxID=1631968 RepID=A0AA48KUF4_9ALTE|nr:hypothetical protein MACH26_19160 [Planctobacterium marinum]
MKLIVITPARLILPLRVLQQIDDKLPFFIEGRGFGKNVGNIFISYIPVTRLQDVRNNPGTEATNLKAHKPP